MYLANSTQIRRADQIQIEEFEYPGIILMETAGRLTAEKILAYYPEQKYFLILAGPGNNGGDGLVIARYLYLAGKKVRVIFSHSPERYQGDALINYQIMAKLGITALVWEGEMAHEPESPVIVDALLGTGIQAGLRGSIAEIIGHFRANDYPVVAVDVPSGLSADSGACINEVLAAEYTFTFQLPKVCHVVTPASNDCGTMEVLDIGIWPRIISQLNISRFLTTDDFVQGEKISRKSDSHKGNFGHILIVGGNAYMAGAIALAAAAAVKSGVGLCTVLSPEPCRQTVLTHSPETMCRSTSGNYLSETDAPVFAELIEGKDAVVIGPGLGNNPDTRAFFRKILPLVKVPLVLDADGLNILSENPDLWAYISPQTVITPHPGEMKRLSGRDDVNDYRLEVAEEMAAKHQVQVLLKGKGTIIALSDGATWVNTTGNPGMASGGSGDVLSGLIGGLCGQGYSPGMAAVTGAFLHGKAGDIAAEKYGYEGVTAMRIVDNFSFDGRD